MMRRKIGFTAGAVVCLLSLWICGGCEDAELDTHTPYQHYAPAARDDRAAAEQAGASVKIPEGVPPTRGTWRAG